MKEVQLQRVHSGASDHVSSFLRSYSYRSAWKEPCVLSTACLPVRVLRHRFSITLEGLIVGSLAFAARQWDGLGGDCSLLNLRRVLCRAGPPEGGPRRHASYARWQASHDGLVPVVLSFAPSMPPRNARSVRLSAHCVGAGQSPPPVTDI